MVLAHHLIWTIYGYWLPNDPRGSGSKVIAQDVLKDLGEIHYGRKRIQPPGRIVGEFQKAAQERLMFPVLELDEAAINEVANAFEQVIRDEGLTCYACAIMPDHVHMVIRRHRLRAEDMLRLLKSASALRLIEKGHRMQDHPVWTSGDGWKVFLDDPAAILRTIPYVERNPLPLGKPIQRWPFVVEYDVWPHHKSRGR